MLTVKVEISPGENIEKAFADAINLAEVLSCAIRFDFNGITCIAYKNGDAKAAAKQYLDKEIVGRGYIIAGRNK